MDFEALREFISSQMRMSHVYQPVMIQCLLDNAGRASARTVAASILAHDESQIEYYERITRNMPGRVLRSHGVVRREGQDFVLKGFDALSPEQAHELRSLCQTKLEEYKAKRGEAVWKHRKQSSGYIPGTLRYEVLKRAKFHCELCGISAEIRALEIDHIVPRNKGGSDDEANLQALCYSCNAMKRDLDDTDFRAVNASFHARKEGCPFCNMEPDRVVEDSPLAYVVRDAFPVAEGHTLVIPKRHIADYFELGRPEQNAIQRLLAGQRASLLALDASISGFNVGVNVGEVAGQTVLHCHVHLIPRRAGDHPNPRGGVRAVIQGKADYQP